MPLPPTPTMPTAPQAQQQPGISDDVLQQILARQNAPASPTVSPELLEKILSGQQAAAELTPLQTQMTRVNELRGYQEPQGYQAAGMYQAASPLAHIGAFLNSYGNEKEYKDLEAKAKALRGDVAAGQGAATTAGFLQKDAALASGQQGRDIQLLSAMIRAQNLDRLVNKDQATNQLGQDKLDFQRNKLGKPVTYIDDQNNRQTFYESARGIVDANGNPVEIGSNWTTPTEKMNQQKFDQKAFVDQQKLNAQSGKPVMYTDRQGNNVWLRQTNQGMVNAEDGQPFALTGDWQISEDENLPLVLRDYGKNMHKPITEVRKAYLDVQGLSAAANKLTADDIKALNQPGLNNVVKTFSPASFETYLEQNRMNFTPRAKEYLAAVNRVGAGIRHELYGAAVTANENAFFESFSPTAVGVDFSTRKMRTDEMMRGILNEVNAYSTDPRTSIIRDLPKYSFTDFEAEQSGKPKGRTVEQYLNMSATDFVNLTQDEINQLPKDVLNKLEQRFLGGD